MKAKTPSESRTTLTDLVLPSETNPLNNLLEVNFWPVWIVQRVLPLVVIQDVLL